MTYLKTSHFLTGKELNKEETIGLLNLAEMLAQERRQKKIRSDLNGMILTLLFEKPSLRTRVSFTVAIKELGGETVECLSSTKKEEKYEDVVRVLAGYSHGIILRTHQHANLERMAGYSNIPLINGLSDSHHPCQVLADLLTLKQHFGKVDGLTLTYIGDGNNILNSLILMMPPLGIHIRYACPTSYQPDQVVVNEALARAQETDGSISAFTDPSAAIHGANAVYTDVWTSMGFEKEEKERQVAFQGFQLNEAILSKAEPGAIVMHCMPMNRGQEISETLPESPASVIFKQSENRLHVQKALLLALIKH